MRVLIAGLANYGHIYPLMPVAVACRDAGHDVIFAIGEELLPLVRSAGFTGHRVAASLEWGWTEAIRRRPELSSAGELAIAPVAAEILAERVMRDLLPVLARERPDVVLHEPYCPGAALAARLAGVPVVSHIQGRSLPARMHDAISGHLDRLWREHGGTADLPDWRAQTFLDFWPPSLQPDPPVVELVDRHPVRPVAWSGRTDRMPGWVPGDRDKPLVYLVFSTVFDLDDAVLDAVLRGVAALDADVLAVVGSRHDRVAPRLPGNVRVERFVAQAQVLPHADLVVCHGGSGVFLGALSAGLPQLVIPSGADQFSNADDLVRVGAGMRMMPGEVTSSGVTEAVAALTGSPAYRQAARAIAREIAAMPAPADLVPVLGELAGAVAVESL
ncbi:glycosyltransferase [Actinophytocola glycyrrhizae]|uniref:Glycosyltransferase n=1 Tax=Actinophytocola glycyrrhizae TaxID=2044873 RepID=A0ABV9S8J8_9PSEU